MMILDMYFVIIIKIIVKDVAVKENVQEILLEQMVQIHVYVMVVIQDLIVV